MTSAEACSVSKQTTAWHLLVYCCKLSLEYLYSRSVACQLEISIKNLVCTRYLKNGHRYHQQETPQ